MLLFIQDERRQTGKKVRERRQHTAKGLNGTKVTPARPWLIVHGVLTLLCELQGYTHFTCFYSQIFILNKCKIYV